VTSRYSATDPPVAQPTPADAATAASAVPAAAQPRSRTGAVPAMEAPSQAQVSHSLSPSGPTSGTDATAATQNASSRRRRAASLSQGVTAAYTAPV